MKRISLIILLIGIFFSVSAQIKIYNATTEETKGDQLGVLIGKEIFLTDKNGVKGEKVGEYKDDGNLYYVTNNVSSISDFAVSSDEVIDINTAESFEILADGVIKSINNYIVVGFSNKFDIKAVGALLLLQTKYGLRE
ncbi:MAG: hypothetical protein HXX09_02120 [Bacteroidetes bacterium]|nr:hypothetical protein [Bacteroidota bacterium]